MQEVVTPSRVIVEYPRGAQTGGPEALHQLVDSLRRQGVDAWLWPHPDTRHLPRVSDYERYDAPESTEMIDECDTAVVSPEVYWPTRRWKNAALFCWWLSIDNSHFFRQMRRAQYIWTDNGRVGRRTVKAVAKEGLHLVGHVSEMRRVTHLTQSNYAWHYLHSVLGIAPTMLGDYIPDAQRYAALKPAVTEPSIAFNPNKSGKLTNQIRAATDSEIAWLPIQGLDRQGVGELLDRATLYLETGHQPGKDRLPREAALRGCVVLMLRRGAGANSVDCPLPQRYKVMPGDDAAGRFAVLIRDVLEDLDLHRALQTPYTDMVLSDRLAFDRAVRGIFLEGHRGLDNWLLGTR